MTNKSQMRQSQNGWPILIATRVVSAQTRDIALTVDTDVVVAIIDCYVCL